MSMEFKHGDHVALSFTMSGKRYVGEAQWCPLDGELYIVTEMFRIRARNAPFSPDYRVEILRSRAQLIGGAA